MTSGIYCFKHKLKPFVYIGSSNNIENRYKQHITSFENKQHHNLSLQKDFLRDVLEFDVLAKGISKNNLLKMEQEYCAIYLDKGYLLYNSKLPKPQNYDNDMLCSKKVYDGKLGRYHQSKNNHIIKYQEMRLSQCFEEIYRLNQEVRRLKQELGYNFRENIFSQIEEYGEIKEW